MGNAEIVHVTYKILFQSFKGNVDSKLQTSMLRPPVVADDIKIIPEIYPDTQVCMRFELLGCSFTNGELFCTRAVIDITKTDQ